MHDMRNERAGELVVALQMPSATHTATTVTATMTCFISEPHTPPSRGERYGAGWGSGGGLLKKGVSPGQPIV